MSRGPARAIRGTPARVGRLLLMALGATCLPRAVPGQADNRPCDLYFDNTLTTHTHSVRPPGGKYTTFFAGGIIAHCRNQGNTLKADSAEYYDDQSLLYLIGHVHYTEPRVTVDARRMTYYVPIGRLVADSDVFAVMASGTTMRGPHADYLRVLPGVRARAQLTATGRPHMHLVQRDSASTAPDTAGVDADRVLMDGDSLVYASRKVVINRTDLTSTSDSAMLNQAIGYARLVGKPVIKGRDLQHPFTLRGDMIDLFATNHQLTRVVSMRHGDVLSRDMHVTSDTIDLRFADKVLSRAYAWGPSRAHATTPERDILADSIDAVMPGQVMHEVRAVRKAFATSVPDTTHFKSTERDWMKGDTIIAYFDSTGRRQSADSAHSRDRTSVRAALPGSGVGGQPRAPGAIQPPPGAPVTRDTQPEVRTIVADGDARALYQLAPSDRTETRPALNYVRGRVITIHLRNHQVQTVTVIDSAAGVYLEPAKDSVKIDSMRRARALADTLPASRRKKQRPRTPPLPAKSAPQASSPAGQPVGGPAPQAPSQVPQVPSQGAPQAPPSTPGKGTGQTPPDSGAAP